MSRVLLFYAGLSSPGNEERDRERLVGFARAALGSGHEVVVGIPEAEEAAVRRWLDARAGPPRVETLDTAPSRAAPALSGLLGRLGADAVVGLATSSLLACGELESDLPLWLDVAEEICNDAIRARAASLGEPPSHAWQRLLWALDRADRFSCATAGQAAHLESLLALRGRARGLDGNDEAGVAVAVIPAGSEPEALLQWLEGPGRTAPPAPLLGRGEAALSQRLAFAEAQLTARALPRWRRLAARMLASPPVEAGGGALGRASRSMRALATAAATGVSAVRLVASTRALGAGAWLRGRGTESSAPSPGRSGHTTARERAVRPAVLIVMPYPIYPPNHGGGVRLFNLIRRLAPSCRLHVLLFSRTGGEPAQRRALEPFCEEVHVVDWEPRFDPPSWSLVPPNAYLFGSTKIAERIRDLVTTRGIEVVQLEYTELAQYRHHVGGAKVILVEHDLAFQQMRRRRAMGFGERFPDSRAYGWTRRDWQRLLRYEITACRQVDQIHVMSEHDGKALARYLPDGFARIRVVPNGVDVDHYSRSSGEQRGDGALLVGNFQNLPNVDALGWFVEAIWPEVRRRLPGARLAVAGAMMPPAIRELSAPGVEVLGEVADLGVCYRSHGVLAVPLRVGSGTRLKILEAFASGIPVVSTRVGAEGIGARDGEHLLLAEDAESFAAQLVRCLVDRDLGAGLARAALGMVRERFDWSAIADLNLAGIHELAEAMPARRAARERAEAGQGP